MVPIVWDYIVDMMPGGEGRQGKVMEELIMLYVCILYNPYN